MNQEKFAFPKIIQKLTDDSNTTVYNRPLVGIILFDKSFGLSTSINEVNIKEYLKYLFLHEFTHILGFITEYIQALKHKDPSPYIHRINTNDEIQKFAIQTDNVLDCAKEYFNCSNMQYLEIEEQESKFEKEVTNSHWDARILLGEYMTSEPYFGDQVISNFTLSLLDDLSFYKTNKFTGGLMRFGKNRGCNFLGYDGIAETPYDCITRQNGLVVSHFPNEFCKNSNRATCSSGRQSRTYCITDPNADVLPTTYYEGRDIDNLWGKSNADFCPVSEILENSNSVYVGNCYLGDGKYGSRIFNSRVKNYESEKYNEAIGQIYGDNSFCALSSLLPLGVTRNESTKIKPICYPMFCTDKSLTIQICQQYFVCPQNGGIVKEINNYVGYIYIVLNII